jgi:hypothetical protein
MDREILEKVKEPVHKISCLTSGPHSDEFARQLN